MTIAYYLLPPPYDEPAALGLELYVHARPRAGELCVLRPGHDAEVAGVLDAITDLKTRFATVTIVLWVDLLPSPLASTLAGHAGSKSVRGFIRRGVVDPVLLRGQLTDRASLGIDISTWLTLHGHRPPKVIRNVIEWTVNNVETCSTASAAAAAAGTTLTRVRSALDGAGLPNPRDFFQIVRLLTIAVTLQRDVDAALSTVAESHGYWDAAALRHRLQDVVGAAPTDIRRYLGWEWLLFQALRRAGVVIASH